MIKKIDNVGRIVLPKVLREAIDANLGDDMNLEVEGDTIVITKANKINKYIALKNCIADFKSHLEELDESEVDERSKGQVDVLDMLEKKIMEFENNG